MALSDSPIIGMYLYSGQTLKELREGQKLGIGRAAGMIKVSGSTWHSWEREETSPSAHRLRDIANLFKVVFIVR